MADDIIEIEDYEVKDKQIVETSDEDDSNRTYDNQREYSENTGFYRSFSLDGTAMLIVFMVVILLVIIFIMTFE